MGIRVQGKYVTNVGTTHVEHGDYDYGGNDRRTEIQRSIRRNLDDAFKKVENTNHVNNARGTPTNIKVVHIEFTVYDAADRNLHE